ncbi:MAG TPA: methyltransferase domain-containing protein, partial [Thermoanaerobaculia bacterium]|nr:methyltransferase domain-containing protein [Thermoanaerobaculia bacterium]
MMTNAEDLARVEAALAEHPAVQSAAVRPGQEGVTAYVVPKPAPVSVEPASGQVSQWQSLWEQTYTQLPASGDPTLNLSGWSSSYTGKPIRQDEMKDWVERTVERILALQPRRVLEIGCGMGLLLFRIAPRVESYHGVDFSPEALGYVHQNLAGLGLANVELIQGTAEDLAPLQGAGPFDVAVINSVVQYFPDAGYLERVLAGLVDLLAPGGHIFIGDVRSFALLEAFHTSVQMLQADGDTPLPELRERIDKLVREERELVIDPGFFTALLLRRRRPRIGRVEIQLKRGRYKNELTRFRYDAVLHLDTGAAVEPERWLDWREAGLSVAALRSTLAEEQPAALGVRGIPNARLAAEVRAVELLRSDKGGATVDDLLAAVRGVRGGIEPEDLWALGKYLPYTVELGWRGAAADGAYQAVFRHRDKAAGEGTEPVPEEEPFVHTNQPVKEQAGRQLAAELRRFLSSRLPEELMPASL